MTSSSIDKAVLPIGRRSTRQLMGHVIGALIPGTLLYMWLVSPAVLINIACAVLAAVLFEALAVACRHKPVAPVISDGSIVLAAILLALALPPLLPLWQLLIGVAAMVFLGKHVYGGLGNNPFNPAMVGYAVLLVSFPQMMTGWLAPQVLENTSLFTLLVIKLTSGAPMLAGSALSWDAITMATPLDQLRTLSATGNVAALSPRELSDTVRQAPWLWVNLGYLVGGLYLLAIRVIRWHIPVSLLLTLALLHALYGMWSELPVLPVHWALLSGAAMLGAFFIATDPVSAATSNTGRLIYGAGIGALTFLLRHFSAYPEGIAFAVLLMNMTVPALDYWLTPRSRHT